MPESAVPEFLRLEIIISQQGIYSQDMILMGMCGTNKFNIEQQEIMIYGSKQNFFNRLTFGMFQEFMGAQIHVVGRKV